MQAEIILGLGVLILAGGSISMLILRLCSPNLQGMGWLSASFGSGTLGAALLLVQGPHTLSVLGADLFLLGAFVLLHVAVLQLSRVREIHFWHCAVLLGVQAAVDAAYLAGQTGARSRVTCLGLLVALQATVTARVLWRSAGDKLPAPAVYSVVLLLSFAAFNVARSFAIATGVGSRVWREQLALLAFSLFIAVALGLAFGFFWMTTAALTAEVEHIASTDPLTRVYNRRVFLKWCEKELLRTQRSHVPFSLLMLDLDHFKRVNDNFGHQRGDEVLCAAVERMQDSVRGIDVLCRWGGEEFAVLLPNASLDSTRIVAERIRENIQKMRVPLEKSTAKDEVPCLTVSIGAATYQELEDDIPTMLLRADRALYQAKTAGRNRALVGV